MHPIRVETIDLVQMTHTLEYGGGLIPVSYPLLWAEQTASGLHFARAYVGHPDIQFMECHILPDLGLLVNRFTGTDWSAQSDYYVDIASVIAGEDSWVTHDLYLDLSARAGGMPAILDTDEYLAAVQEGLLNPEQAVHALTSLHRLVNGVLACGSLEAWLEQVGITLSWRGRPTAATADGPVPS
ncbi:DUF402 domain-containing protein [Deinococcus humi]|uniref:DUF402 domain-containing protein n=1 Tax=Deinococcus humi TaxID=662880 RepID=A0A7W8K0H2_9DEIO|nr:DUF402 domain-containing protein [Deinococcus humi]MBB5366233.1 hypothetical protein [Deinococcus humi]